MGLPSASETTLGRVLISAAAVVAAPKEKETTAASSHRETVWLFIVVFHPPEFNIEAEAPAGRISVDLFLEAVLSAGPTLAELMKAFPGRRTASGRDGRSHRFRTRMPRERNLQISGKASVAEPPRSQSELSPPLRRRKLFDRPAQGPAERHRVKRRRH